MSASAFTAVFGAVSGIGCAAFANGLRKLPPFSRA
jgi:hypothetical protein